MSNKSITEEGLQKVLNASRKRLEDLEKRYDTAIEQYQDCLSKDIEIEKDNIEVLEEKIKEIRQDKFERLNSYDEYMSRKNRQDKTFCSLNNFENCVLQSLNILHLENTMILSNLLPDRKLADSIIKMYNEMFYKNLRDNIGIKVDYESK